MSGVTLRNHDVTDLVVGLRAPLHVEQRADCTVALIGFFENSHWHHSS